MLFVAPRGFPSSFLRGEQIARFLDVPCVESVDDTQNDVVVFVKSAKPSEVQKAKNQGNLIAYDVLDFFCYPDRYLPWAHLVDVLIVPNSVCEPVYQAFFQNAKQVVIPHQWDSRIQLEAKHDKPRLGYVGAVFNMPSTNHLFEAVVENDRMVSSAHLFNLHLCVTRREDMAKLLKPATKIATAAAVGACAITHLDPSAMELLGEEYPFYVHTTLDEAISDAVKSFGGERWMRARRIMKDVREKTSLRVIAEKYRQLEVALA